MKHIKTLKLAAVTAFLKITSLTAAFADQPNLDKLTPRPGQTETNDYKELDAIKDLPSLTMESAISNIIKTVLGWSMILTLVALVVTGIFYLKSQGEDEDTSKAKKMIMYLLIGVMVIAASYGIVSGIAKINFFEAV
ncbi:MAG: hypothetical protein WC651_04900 [Candidatus Gracilibacteria bacterium]|jgi:hypothetical protein